jgi:hypothetical protein
VHCFCSGKQGVISPQQPANVVEQYGGNFLPVPIHCSGPMEGSFWSLPQIIVSLAASCFEATSCSGMVVNNTGAYNF